MLVLSRKLNEELVIDGNIRIRVVHVGEGKVRIGIDAPATVGIRRGELDDRATAPLDSVLNSVAASPETRNNRDRAGAQSTRPDGLFPVVATGGSGPFVLPLLDLNRLSTRHRPR